MLACVACSAQKTEKAEESAAAAAPAVSAEAPPVAEAPATSVETNRYTGEVYVVRPGEMIQDAVVKARPGDTIKVMPGQYSETVYIDKDDIHLLGVVIDNEWPVLDGEGQLNDGILVSGHGVTVEGMYVRRFLGNGIMTQGGNNFKIIRNRVEGRSFYGIFPQFGKNGLVANNEVWNIEDAAIYAGMCENVDIVANETYGSVIGIETENSQNMLIEGNYAHDNSTGVIMTLVPGLPIKVSRNTILRNNFIIGNNTPNFAPEGAISANIPSGTGVFIWASDEMTIENNLLRDNQTVAIMIADQAFVPGPPDPKEDPMPDKNRILKNMYIDNGGEPIGAIADLLAATGQEGGVDIITTGIGRENCILDRDTVRHLGVDQWADCAAGATSTHIDTMQTPEPVVAPSLTNEQKGRLTYLAVCTGCHSYTNRIVGPPMRSIQALYKDNPDALAAWIANPTKKRENYPNMPPQNYLPEDVRKAVANYIVYDLEQ